MRSIMDQDSAGVPARAVASPSASAPDDPRVIAAMEEYCALLHAGQKPDREAFLACHADIAEPLAKCLDGLEFVYTAAPQLSRFGEGSSAAAGDEVEPSASLGDFRIVREIGRGGMGVVYDAVQLSLGRRVALKVLPFAAALDAKQLQRFKNEAQAAAHLHHQNIVPVHFVGCERGVHFYAMQYIDGQTLAAVIQELRQQAGKEDRGSRIEDRRSRIEDRGSNGPDGAGTIDDRGPVNETKPSGPLSSILDPRSSFFRTVARLGVQAAEALEHAHQLGVIHRDIKPANLLVDAGGRLWITDFGLAHCQSQPGLSMTGDVLGTLRYMSPEQALAKRSTLDARTDVYSLGATLYELLTLEPAYNGRNREEVLRQIAFEEPCPLRRLNKAVPVELETIVLKAMAKGPEERYATAQELADDLERYLKDEPIRARRPTLVQRLKKWTRRHLSVVWTAGLSFVAMLLLAVIGLAASTLLIMREKAQTDAAKEGQESTLYYQRIALAEREWSANNLSGAEQLLDACPARLRGWEWHYLKRLRLEGIPPLRHTAPVLSAAFSPDGRWIASASQGGAVTLWHATAGGEQFTFQAHERHVNSVAFSPDGRRLATASWDGTAKIWDLDPQRTGGKHSLLHTLLGHKDRVMNVAFSPDGQRLASAGGGPDRTVRVWDVATGHESFICRHTRLWCVAYSPDGQSLASASGDTTVKIWDARTGREKLTLPHSTEVLSVSFSRDGRWLASTTGDNDTEADGEVKVWDARAGEDIRTLRGHTGRVLHAMFSPDGQRLASAGMDETVKLWDLQTGQEILTLRGHRGEVNSVAFSPNGTRLVSASDDGDVRIWDATPLGKETGQESLTLSSDGGGVHSVAFSRDGQWLASAWDDGMVRLWHHKLGRAGGAGPPIRTLGGGRGFRKVLFSHNGQFLASGGGQIRDTLRLKVWATTTWEVLFTLTGDCDWPLAFSPDDKYLATCSSASGTDYTIEIREATTGQVTRILRGHSWYIVDMAFSPNADVPRLASASGDGTVRIWDVTSGTEIVGPPLRHTHVVRCVAFSKDGRLLASGGHDRIVKVWDVATRKLFRELADPTGAVQSMAFHPKDSRVLAWGGRDATVKVWNSATDEIRTLHGHKSWVQSVAFSPDGKWVASASLDGTVKLWQTP